MQKTLRECWIESRENTNTQGHRMGIVKTVGCTVINYTLNSQSEAWKAFPISQSGDAPGDYDGQELLEQFKAWRAKRDIF